MPSSVGRIDLDLGINRQGLQKEVKSVGKMMGHTLSVAVGNIFANLAQSAIKGLGGFLKSSVELGSSIAELENVTSTVFPSMQQQVEDFSKSALSQYGLTEMQTKKMMGTFGAMAQAFKYPEKEAYNMSAALTGLVGDVSSFYNLEHDVAYTKIKSVFTGETESLKELGIVMTQAALDEYALANGFGKTTQAMSEQEKVALRMAFVTDQLSFAAGDFAKTQNQWANQTRILAGQWDSFKSAIGQGFIAVLTPVIQALNKLMAVVVKLGQKFRDFIFLITGKEMGSSSGALMSEISEVTTGAASAADAASDSTASSAKKASKAAKDIKNSVLGFDQLNKLSDPSSSDSGADGGGGAGGGGGASMLPSMDSTSPVAAEADSVIGSLDTMKKKLEEIANWTGLTALWDGISKGISLIDFSAISTNFTSIMESLKPIATLTVNAISVILNSIGAYVGTIAGNVIATTGKAIEIGSGAVAQWLSSESGTITTWIANTALAISTGFDNLTFSADLIFGSFWEALTTNQDTIETSLAGLIGSFATMKMTIGTIFTDMWESSTEGIKNFVKENKPQFDTFFNGIIDLGTNAMDLVSQVFGDFFGILKTWWDGDGKRIWDGIVQVFTDLWGWVMRLWNEVLQPVFMNLVNKLREVWNTSLKPLWEKILQLLSSVWDGIKLLWDNILKPVIDWLITILGPYVKDVATIIINTVGDVLKNIGKSIGGIMDFFRGIIDFLVGVFTGDWQRAWDGIKNIFGGLKAFFQGIWDAIKSIFSGVDAWFESIFKTAREAIKSVFSGIANWFESTFKTAWEAVKNVFSSGGEIFSGIVDGVVATFKKIVNALIDGINSVVKAPFQGLNNILSKIQGIEIAGFKPFSWLSWRASIPQIPHLAEGGYVRANQPQLAVIGDNKRHGEIVAPEDKLYEIVSAALQSFMGQLISALSAGSNSQANETLQFIIQIGEETIVNRIIKRINSESRRQGATVIKV